MEAVLKNVAGTAELLAVASLSGEVERWEEPTVSRAFQWARYCEHLCRRFHDNPAIRRVIEKQLRVTNHGLRAAFAGYGDVSFSDLYRCQHLLLVGLLKNPQLPISVMKILFDAEQNSSAVGADAEVQAEMLMERLGALLSRGGEARHILDSVPQGFEGAAGHFCVVIAAALLMKKNSSQDFLLDWLQKEQSVLEQMCSSLPSALIIELTKKQPKFRDAFCDLLKKWASDMEYSLSEGEWIQTRRNPTVSFDRLTEHFLGLFETCPSVRVDVEEELNALKMSDGDFDVRGLSVWGDLLSVFNKSV
uniref:Fanconi anemia group F protein isoform X2 n=1 Tax=Gasterosteus aculeatus aculeatus TaxID=481459 RepID=UPI001A98EDF6|nr:Fanconi anemia group F protein isoform X2 [Gasterosteus aculeatus aculeatus]